MDVYLQSRSLTMEELREEVKESAEKRLKRSLILMEISNQEDIQISSDKINERVRNTLDEVTKYYSEDEAKRLGSGENLQNLISRIATDEVINLTLQRIRDIAMGKEIEAEAEEEEKTEEAGTAETEVEAEPKAEESAEQEALPAEEAEAEKTAETEED
jgi:trigger factor